MAINLSEADLHKGFEAYDKEGSGYITIEETRQVLKHLNVPVDEQKLHDIANKIDKERFGAISYPEYIQLVTGKQPTAPYGKTQQKGEASKTTEHKDETSKITDHKAEPSPLTEHKESK